MKSNGNKIYRIYDKSLHQWFEVPKEYYETYDRERTAFRKRMQDHGQCCCPRNKWWLCDTICTDCEFCMANTIPLDAPQGDDEDITLKDIIPDGSPLIEDVITERDLLARLIKRLRELDPDADTILALWQEDFTMSDRAMAKALGRPQRTFADQMKRYRTELRKIRGY